MSKSILLVNTPKHCSECQLMISGHMCVPWCSGLTFFQEIQDEDLDNKDKRPAYCPLIPISKSSSEKYEKRIKERIDKYFLEKERKDILGEDE